MISGPPHFISTHTAVHYLVINGTCSAAIHTLQVTTMGQQVKASTRCLLQSQVSLLDWTTLIARLVILTAVSSNVSGKQAANLLMINVVLSILMVILIVFNKGTKLYSYQTIKLPGAILSGKSFATNCHITVSTVKPD